MSVPSQSGRAFDGERTILRNVGECLYGSLWWLEPKGREQEQLCVLRPYCTPHAGMFARVIRDLQQRKLPPDLVPHPKALVLVRAETGLGPQARVRLTETDGTGCDPLTAVALLEPACEQVELNPFEKPADLDALRQLAESLAALHKVGLLHGEIGPAALVRTAGRFALAGAVITHAVNREINQDMPSTAAHSPPPPCWVAPELLRGQPRLPASDVYALSVLAYGMLCGALPFAGLSPWDYLHALVQGVEWAPADERLRNATAGPLREALLAGLTVDPSKRLADGTAFLEALPRKKRGWFSWL